MNRFLFIVLSCMPIFDSEAQVYYKFSGTVQDSVNGDFVPFALIYDSLSGKQTETDQYGRFTLNIKEGNYNFIISYVGFQTRNIRILLDKDIYQVIQMSTIILPELVVQGTSSIKIENGHIDISAEKLKSVPTLLGEKDVLKAIAILPGVAPGNDGTNQFSVRGGGFDQNLILLDGSVMYNTSHFFGFLSSIDPFAIKSMRFYKDGFPAEYGGRLSSVVDIKLKEGNFNQTESYMNIGIVTSSLGLNGPLKKEKVSFLFSTRIAYPGLLTLPFKFRYENEKQNAFVSYFMYDLVYKLSWKVNSRHSLFLSGTAGKDFLLSGNKENNFRTDWNIKWGNSIMALKYNGILNRSLDLKFNANFTDYKYSSRLKGTELLNNYTAHIINLSQIQDFKMGADLGWNIFHSMDLISGIMYNNGTVLPEIRYNDLKVDTSSSISRFSSNEFSIYQTLKFNLSRSIKLSAGYRYSNYKYKRDNFNFWQPRLTLGYQHPENKFDMSLSYSKMYQPVHLLLNSSNGYVNEVWLAANKALPPQQMNEFTLGFHFKRNWGNIGLSVYSRKFQNIIELKDNIRFLKFFTNDWTDLFEKDGIGFSNGFEMSYMHQFKKLNMIAAYSFNKSRRTFENINQGNQFRSPVERPHVFSANMDYVKSERSTITLGLTYFSGTPVTLPDYTLGLDFFYTERYNSRLPSYKRVDIALKRLYTNSKGLPKEWTFSIYNLFFNRNIMQVFATAKGYFPQGTQSSTIEWRPYFYGRSFFNFIPGINFYYKFK